MEAQYYIMSLLYIRECQYMFPNEYIYLQLISYMWEASSVSLEQFAGLNKTSSLLF